MLAYELQRYRMLAKKAGVPLVLLSEHPPQPSLLHYEAIGFYRDWGCIPWRKVDGVLVVASTRHSAACRRAAEAQFGAPVLLVYCTPRDLRLAIEQAFGITIAQDTRTRILRTMPQLSAYYQLSQGQIVLLGVFFALILAAITTAPSTFLLALVLVLNGLYLLSIAFKCLLAFKAIRLRKPQPEALALLQANEEAQLPVYSILIPMYREAQSVPRLLDAIRNLNYPKDKLDVKLVLEADDAVTLKAIISAAPEPYFDILRVPPSDPRTKPKACSYALTFARGDFVTIYDAEDRPDPQQLKKAVAAFRAAPEHVICLQGRLNYYNAHENFLTRCFAIEYANLFDFMLHGLAALRLPIPLGGTSNHLHLKRLRELMDWDPYNVTEDADLGIRLATRGFETRMLDSLTLEEAPIHLTAWLKQRTRWIKGYMQTWLVYMRQPLWLLQHLGLRGFVGFQLFIGLPCLIFLCAPLLWIICGLWAGGVITSSQVPEWLGLSCWAVLALGISSQVALALLSIRRWKWRGMIMAALCFPFYFLLHSAASLRALIQLLLRPHYWDKTEHAQTRLSEPFQQLTVKQQASISTP